VTNQADSVTWAFASKQGDRDSDGPERGPPQRGHRAAKGAAARGGGNRAGAGAIGDGIVTLAVVRHRLADDDDGKPSLPAEICGLQL
jgi:hypothetical protein